MSHMGSNSEVAAVASQVCSNPNNRHSPHERTRPFGATNGPASAASGIIADALPARYHEPFEASMADVAILPLRPLL